MIPVTDDTQAHKVHQLGFDLGTGVLTAQLTGFIRRKVLAVGGFDLVLNGQAVAVPTRHVGRIKTRQVFGLNDNIFENFINGVTDMDTAVGVGRAIVQYKQRRTRTGFAQALV